MNAFDPQLHILPAPQLRLWPALSCVPRDFVLYGGTAVGLRLGHRSSMDFDFFSNSPFSPENLVVRMPFLKEGTRLQSEPNTLTLLLEGQGPVKISFFGGLTFGRVGKPEQARDNGLAVASKLDLAATKARVVIERAERKDYLDVAGLIRSGIQLSDALGAARALYGDAFNPMITLKALSYFADGDLPKLPDDVKTFLIQHASQVTNIPQIACESERIGA